MLSEAKHDKSNSYAYPELTLIRFDFFPAKPILDDLAIGNAINADAFGSFVAVRADPTRHHFVALGNHVEAGEPC